MEASVEKRCRNNNTPVHLKNMKGGHLKRRPGPGEPLHMAAQKISTIHSCKFLIK